MAAEELEGFPLVLLFHLSGVDQGKQILDRYWPEARAVSDPDRVIYKAFGRRRGSLKQVLGPRVLWAGLKAAFKGNAPGKAQGDILTMPGMFLVQDGEILWQHDSKHSGDHPQMREIVESVGARRVL